MTASLDHVILPTNDQAATAAFVAKMLGRPEGVPLGHFIGIPLDNGITIDVMETDGHESVHLAFLVDDDTFDRAMDILRSEQLPHWADPGHSRKGEINQRLGGRGVYFADPGGNNLELLTRSMPLPQAEAASGRSSR